MKINKQVYYKINKGTYDKLIPGYSMKCFERKTITSIFLFKWRKLHTKVEMVTGDEITDKFFIDKAFHHIVVDLVSMSSTLPWWDSWKRADTIISKVGLEHFGVTGFGNLMEFSTKSILLRKVIKEIHETDLTKENGNSKTEKTS